MIGVIASKNDTRVVREFFELFKTPWEPWITTHSYDVVLSTTEQTLDEVQAPLIVEYSGTRLPTDPPDATELSITGKPRKLVRGSDEIPLYRRCVIFSNDDSELLIEHTSHCPVALYLDVHKERRIIRIGYDLFREVEYLLTLGQPTSQARIPTLELHIDLLRSILWSAGISFVEIPPVPYGHPFLACLTHDVDHPAMRNHRWDHTAAGFLYRAALVSVTNLLRGKSTFRTLRLNWRAALQWPLVQAGFSRDLWADFHHHYRQLEDGLPSTYFVIPYANTPGRTASGSAHKHRASAYAARSIEPVLKTIQADGCEVGLHGLDAWLDPDLARQEMEELRNLTRATHDGIRMHWLFFDEGSPRRLEEAGAHYDSTLGYRDTVGFLTGTTQAYVPLGARVLIELPMHAMDVALFFPRYMGLNQSEATTLLMAMVENMARFGGCLTLNWHDRSLSPERLWVDCYEAMLTELKARNVWFATCSQATAWFHKRRSFTFTRDKANGQSPATAADKLDQSLPELTLRSYDPVRQAITDFPIRETTSVRPPLLATTYTAPV